jgi:hypothetical protein
MEESTWIWRSDWSDGSAGAARQAGRRAGGACRSNQGVAVTAIAAGAPKGQSPFDHPAASSNSSPPCKSSPPRSTQHEIGMRQYGTSFSGRFRSSGYANSLKSRGRGQPCRGERCRPTNPRSFSRASTPRFRARRGMSHLDSQCYCVHRTTTFDLITGRRACNESTHMEEADFGRHSCLPAPWECSSLDAVTRAVDKAALRRPTARPPAEPPRRRQAVHRPPLVGCLTPGA